MKSTAFLILGACLLASVTQAQSVRQTASTPTLSQGITLTAEQKAQIAAINARYIPVFQALLKDHPRGQSSAYRAEHNARFRGVKQQREKEVIAVLSPTQR